MKKIYYLIAMAVTAFTFTSCEDVPEPFGQPINPNAKETVVVDPTGSGTEADPYNVAAIIKETKDLESGVTTDKAYYVKGYVESTEKFFDNYGSISYYICDDKEGKTNKFYVYSGQGLGNTKFTSLDGLKAGDAVTICGKITNYKGTIEFQSQNYIVELNGQKEGGESGGGETPSGDAKAISVADFLAAAESTDVWYQITGTVKNMKEDGSDLYGNFDIEDETGSVYVYGLLSEKGGEKKKFQELVAAKGIKNGSKITIIGNRGAYKGTAQVTNAYFVKIEDAQSGGSTGGDVKSVSVADFLAAAESTDVWYQITGTVKNMKEDGSDLYGNFDIEDATGSVYVYGLLSEKGGEKKKFQELIAAKGIKNGSKITIIGNRGAYKGTAQVTNAYFVKVENGESGGTDGIQTISVADFNAAPESTDVWYQLTGTVKNLKDGDKYGNFDIEDATGSVYVYGLLSEKGGEKQKFQELVTAKGIANGKKITIIGNRGSYTNKTTNETKIEVLNAYFVSIE